MRKSIVFSIVVLAFVMVCSTAFAGSVRFLRTRQAVTTTNCRVSDVVLHEATGDMALCGYYAGETIFDTVHLDGPVENGTQIYVMRTDGTGRLKWARQAGGSGVQRAYGAAFDAAGNCFVTGDFVGSATFDVQGGAMTTGPGSDMALLKYDPEGTLLWARQAGGWGDYEAFGYDVAVDGDGNCYVAGRLKGVAFLGKPVESTGLFDGFLAKYDPTGTLLWVKACGDEARGVAVDSSGAVVVTGMIEAGDNGSDIFMKRFASDGTHLWTRTAGGAGSDCGNSVVPGVSGAVFVTGFFSDTAAFGDTVLTSAGATDIFIAKYDADGSVVFVEAAGGTGSDEGRCVSWDGLNTVAVTGVFADAAQIGGKALTSSGKQDAFMALYSSEGAPVAGFGGGGAEDDSGEAVATGGGLTTVVGSFQDGAVFGDDALGTHALNELFLSIIGESFVDGTGDLAANRRWGLAEAVGILQLLIGSR